MSGVPGRGLVRPPLAPWLAGGAVLGVLACLAALGMQQRQVGTLRAQLEQLQERLEAKTYGRPQDPAEDPGIQSMRTHTDEHPQDTPICMHYPGVWDRCPPRCPGHTHTCTAQVSPRSRRQLERPSPSPGPRHQHRQRTALHLVPSHCSTNAEGDVTELWWAPALRQGQGLELSGSIVTVRQAGLYLVYSQVLFHDPTFTMGQVLWRLPPGGRGPGQILLRCVQSMPGQREQAYNSCYSGGAFHLQRGEGLRLAVPRANASLDLTPHGTFLGLVRL
ncbi:tumor necrosis factor ligand superfamily member 13 isoform X2 [Alligator mississippiensis]|uniref:tumor necrosis factor ligand superfamily member 13 isoform X2 n=1 Tax=Alligator mississippiensis TaxID=8496 RepID=UPI00090747D0|nr:tumor necrosis factor ligand superfamily member 13 isoform X2 [Alligator mississippiensis]